jgi:hypothetical protein
MVLYFKKAPSINRKSDQNNMRVLEQQFLYNNLAGLFMC